MKKFIFENDFRKIVVEAENYHNAVDIIEEEYDLAVDINIEYAGIEK